MTRILDFVSSFFAAAFLVLVVLGGAASIPDALAAEPLDLTPCGFGPSPCSDEDCEVKDVWCFEEGTCFCLYDEPIYPDDCNCFY